MSGTQHLIQSMQILDDRRRRRGDVQGPGSFDFVRIKELVEQTSELRPRLAAATEHLRSYVPQSDEEKASELCPRLARDDQRR